MAQLEDYFEKHNQLPNEIQRNLRLIKELDDRVTNIYRRIEE